MSALDALLDSLPRTTLVVGKGGVGKTTCAAGLAALFAQRGQRTLLISTDPAAALANVIGEPVTIAASALRALPSLDVRQLAAADLRREFLDEWRDVIADIVDRGTYLDRADIDGIVDAALPGADEIFALLALADTLAKPATYDRIIVDTAPTGHTLRLLAMPDTFSALLTMLDAMQDKHRFMVRALTHRYKRDRADDFLDEMRRRIDQLRTALHDAQSVAAVVVTRDEPVVRVETERYIEQLAALQLRVAAVIVNAVTRRGKGLETSYGSLPHFIIAAQAEPPVGLDGIVRAMTAAVGGNAGSATRTAARTRGKRSTSPPEAIEPASLVRTLTIVGGKGGVGKSTIACALGVAAVDADHRRTLLVSTDPAPSLADAFGEGDAEWSRRDVEHELADVPGLVVRQMDATAAFARLRDEYQSRIDDLFTALLGRSSGGALGVDLDRDRAIVRDLLALAPPGIDELYALSILGDALHEGHFERIVVDPAPTGHLLRMLDMPAIALDWAHRLMRLMLQYRDLVGLGETAQELLDFAKRTRAFDQLLHDPARASLIIVTLDEPVVRAETERLAKEVHGRGIDVGAIVWNRTRHVPAPLPRSAAERQLFAGETVPSPVGVAAIRGWSAEWASISPIT